MDLNNNSINRFNPSDKASEGLTELQYRYLKNKYNRYFNSERVAGSRRRLMGPDTFIQKYKKQSQEVTHYFIQSLDNIEKRLKSSGLSEKKALDHRVLLYSKFDQFDSTSSISNYFRQYAEQYSLPATEVVPPSSANNLLIEKSVNDLLIEQSDKKADLSLNAKYFEDTLIPSTLESLNRDKKYTDSVKASLADKLKDVSLEDGFKIAEEFRMAHALPSKSKPLKVTKPIAENISPALNAVTESIEKIKSSKGGSSFTEEVVSKSSKWINNNKYLLGGTALLAVIPAFKWATQEESSYSELHTSAEHKEEQNLESKINRGKGKNAQAVGSAAELAYLGLKLIPKNTAFIDSTIESIAKNPFKINTYNSAYSELNNILSNLEYKEIFHKAEHIEVGATLLYALSSGSSYEEKGYLGGHAVGTIAGIKAGEQLTNLIKMSPLMKIVLPQVIGYAGGITIGSRLGLNLSKLGKKLDRNTKIEDAIEDINDKIDFNEEPLSNSIEKITPLPTISNSNSSNIKIKTNIKEEKISKREYDRALGRRIIYGRAF